jgi:hypothetical protein
MGFNIGQQFTSGAPALGGRGAYGIAPMAGSSNLFGAAIPMAGKFGSIFNQIMSSDKPFETAAAYSLAQNADPEYQAAMRKQQLEDAAAFYKEQGDQQMKYNLINRGLTALQTGIERGLTKYQDPYSIANMIANGYAEGARSSAGLAQIGQGMPARNYYRV